MSKAYGADRAGFRDWMGLHETLSTALVTGVVGSAAMMAVAMLGAATLDLPPLHPAIVLGESFVGPEAIEAVAGKVAFGLLVHLVTSIGLAFVVCAILPRDFPPASAMGVGVGLTLLAFMFVLMPLVVPWANPGFRSGMQAMGGTWIIALAVFGAVLGGGPALRRWAAREGAKGGVSGTWPESVGRAPSPPPSGRLERSPRACGWRRERGRSARVRWTRGEPSFPSLCGHMTAEDARALVDAAWGLATVGRTRRPW